jgi:hypothetical protein
MGNLQNKKLFYDEREAQRLERTVAREATKEAKRKW